MKKRYRDIYGCTASISPKPNGCKLIMKTATGKMFANKVYTTERGAKSAMSRSSDGLMKEIKQ
jgi:hypothetical protein